MSGDCDVFSSGCKCCSVFESKWKYDIRKSTLNGNILSKGCLISNKNI